MSKEQRPWWEEDPALAKVMRRHVALAKLNKDSRAVFVPNARQLVVLRCSERGCGHNLATVTATRKGPLYVAWLPWSSRSFPRSGDHHRIIVALADRIAPDMSWSVFQSVSEGAEEHCRQERGEVLIELLNHPCPVSLRDPLFVRCERHLVELGVDRGVLDAAIRTAARSMKPTKLLFPARPSSTM